MRRAILVVEIPKTNVPVIDTHGYITIWQRRQRTGCVQKFHMNSKEVRDQGGAKIISLRQPRASPL
jgi:hypothetical protein